MPRKAYRSRRTAARLHFSDLGDGERYDDDVTSPLRTVVDCARDLPLRESLAVGDSALRQGVLTKQELHRAAGGVRGRGAARARRALGAMDGRSAGPLESAARAILLEGNVQSFEPQLEIRDSGLFVARVDLGDSRRRTAIEADSFTWHGSRAALARDCLRYCELVARGWLMLRFAYEHILFQPDWVLAMVRRACALGDSRTRGRVRPARQPSAA